MFCLDQLTKLYTKLSLPDGKQVEIIPSVFWKITQNSGFAFGMWNPNEAPFQSIFLIGVPAFALILIVLIFIKLQDNQMITSSALTLILGGALGNLVDRMAHGYVIDFVHFEVGKWVTPPFNLADFAIVLGVALMFVSTLFQRQET